MNIPLLLWVPGTFEIIIILVIVLLLFGGKKIPELMKGVGRGIKEFKDGINSKDEDEKKKKDEDSEKKK